MSIFRKLRAIRRDDSFAERAEVERILRKGPHDRPVDIRHNQTLNRLMGGW